MRIRLAQPLSIGVALLSHVGFAQESASVLPKNISRARVVGVQTSGITHSYNENGERALLMNSLNRSVTTQDLAAKNKDIETLYKSLNTYEPGLGDALYKADMHGEANLRVRQMVPAYEYGVTEKLTIGFKVPVVSLKMDARFYTNVTNQAPQIVQSQTLPAVDDGLKKFSQEAPNADFYGNEIFTKNGYKIPSSYQTTGLGDIEAGAKFKYFQNDYFALAVLGGFRAPTTTHVADPSNVLDKSTGDKQWDFAVQSFHDLNITNAWTIGSAVRYTVQLPNTQTMSVKRSGSSDPLPNLNDPDIRGPVRRDLGDTIESEVSTTYGFFSNAVKLSTTYSVDWKDKDTYTGSISGLDYAGLEKNTSGIAHRAEVGLGYSTIPAFRAKRFAVPLELKIAYNHMLMGVNRPDSHYGRFDFIVYF